MAASNAAFNRTIRGAILRQLQPRLVVDNFVNRELVRGSFNEPEDTVNVIMNDDVEIEDYDGSFGALQEPKGTTVTITAEHSKGFRFKAASDDTAAQIASSTTLATAVDGLLVEAQKYVLSLVQGAELSLSANFARGSDSIKDMVTEVAIKMDNANAGPRRWMVLPPHEFHDIKDELETRDTAFGDDVVRGAGFGGVYKGISIFSTSEGNFYKPSTLIHAMAGVDQSIAYEDAILDIRRNPALTYSGDQVDGVHVGGGKVVRPAQTFDIAIDAS